MQRSVKEYLTLGGIVLLLAAITLAFVFVSPEEVVAYVGVENTYLVIFLMAAIGGLSALTGLSYFAALAAFAAGGGNPLLLGLAAGTGIFISDSIFFYLALHGRHALPDRWELRLARLMRWSRRVPERAVLAGVYGWLAFTPLPNDVLMIGLAVAGYRYKTLAPVIWAGSVTLALLIAFLARAGITVF